MKEIEGIRVVPDPTVELLNPRQYVDYEAHREKFLQFRQTGQRASRPADP